METLRQFKSKHEEQHKEVVLGTYNFKRIQAVCNDALNNRLMIGLIGEPGFGKTVALSHFVKTNEGSAFMMSVKPSMKAKNFWIELYEALPGAVTQEKYSLYDHRGLYYVLRKVSEHLNARSRSLLVIDEAGKFSTKMLEYLHELRDETKETTGIVLAGPSYFKSNLVKWVRSHKIGMPEIFRRINYWEELLPPTRSEIKSFCSHYEIEDDAFVTELQRSVKNFGVLQNVINEYLRKGGIK